MAKSRSRQRNAGHRLQYLWTYFMVGANAFAILLMWLTAVSPYLDPSRFPRLSILGLGFPILLIVNAAFALYWCITSWRKLWLPLVGFALCFGSIRAYCPVNLPEELPKSAIKVVSYNTLSFGERAENEEGVNKVIDYLAKSQADIICVQEASPLNEEKWRKKALRHLPRTPHCDYVMTGSYNAIGIFSRYPILSHEKLFEADGNVSAAFRLLVGTDTVIVVNSHLESFRMSKADLRYQDIVQKEEQEAKNAAKHLLKKLATPAAKRARQADTVSAYIARQHLPVISCGDFNDTPISYTRRVMSRQLSDAYARTGNGPGFTFKHSGVRVRIDHLHHSDHWRSYACRVDSKIELSDHFPISAYLTLERSR